MPSRGVQPQLRRRRATLALATIGLCCILPVDAKEAQPPAGASKAKRTITEEQAKAIALKAVPGKVSDVAIEKKRGKNVYVVEIVTDKEVEKDVLVDPASGKVLGIE